MRMKLKKRIIIFLISIILILFVGMFTMTILDNKYINDVRDNIKENTDIKNIEYVNKYDNNYIVVNDEYLYLFNLDYEEIARIDMILVHENNNNYDIVYKNETIMYMDNYKNKNGVIFEYYDIYTYELIETIVVGGN